MLTIKRKLQLLTFTLVASVLLNGIICFVSTKTLVSDIEHLSETAIAGVEHSTLADMMHDSLRANVYLALYSVQNGQANQIPTILKETEEAAEEFNKRIEALGKLNLEQSVKEKLEQVKPTVKAYGEAAVKITSNAEKTSIQELSKELPGFNKQFEDLEEKMAKITEPIVSSSKEFQNSAKKNGEHAASLVIVLGIVIGCFGLFAGFLVTQNLIKSFSEIIIGLSQESNLLNKSAQKIQQASMGLSESSTEQAAAIEETVSSMEEMTSMLAQSSQNADKSLQVSEEGKDEASRGKEVIGKMLGAMAEIEDANEKLEKLSELITEIGNKTKVINQIVFETRLLSFNASIEAARAGVHGKGFAVVAEEVGKLASMSGKAADEIRNLLESSTTEVNKIVRDTKERVSFGKSVSGECEATFISMGETLEKIAASINLITAASKEQEAGIRQTNQAMLEMDKVTQKNSSDAEQLSHEAGSLAESAKGIDLSIQTLTSIVGISEKTITLEKNNSKKQDNKPQKNTERASNVISIEKMFNAEDKAPIKVERTAVVNREAGGLSRRDSRWKAS